MSIPSLCKSISSTLTHNLRLATSNEQRCSFAAAALDQLGKIVLPKLDTILLEKGETSDDYQQSRDAVLELLTFVTIPFLRNCSDYGWGIAFLAQVAEQSEHSQVKMKLAIYSNQLKKRWNAAEPGGIHHTPRAKRAGSQLKVSTGFTNAIGITLLSELHSIFPPTSI